MRKKLLGDDRAFVRIVAVLGLGRRVCRWLGQTGRGQARAQVSDDGGGGELGLYLAAGGQNFRDGASERIKHNARRDRCVGIVCTRGRRWH